MGWLVNDLLSLEFAQVGRCREIGENQRGREVVKTEVEGSTRERLVKISRLRRCSEL
jgi:hypothetical protein